MCKKLSALFCSLLSVFSLISCQSTPEISTSGISGVESFTGASSFTTQAVDETTSTVFEVDKGLFSVTIVFPASIFKGTDISSFDIEGYVKENGFQSAKFLDDGSLEVTMTKFQHLKILKEVSDELDFMLSEIIHSNLYPYILDIVRNDEFSSFTMYVDRDEFLKDFCMVELSIIASAGYYHMFLGTYPTVVEFTTIDNETGEIIDQNIY